MTNIALIAAAGYHGYWTTLEGVERCPESMLAITPKGNSTAARLALQFSSLGYMPFLAVGLPGCTFEYRNAWYANHYGFPPDPDISISPWTWDLVRQAAEVAIPLLMPDPDCSTQHDTFCRCLDMIGQEWDRLVMIPGDHLITRSLLKDALELPFPFQLRATPMRPYKMYGLTPDAASLYRRLAGDAGRRPGRGGWDGNKRSEHGTPSGQEFAKVVPIRYIEDALPGHEHYELSDDIDCPKTYFKAAEWLEKYGED